MSKAMQEHITALGRVSCLEIKCPRCKTRSVLHKAALALLRRHVCVDQIQGDELRVPGPSLNNGSRKTEQNASSIIYDRIRPQQFGLSGSPSQSFETDDGLKLSSKIRGSFASEYVVDLVNCMATGSLQGNVISSAWSRCALIRSCSSRSAYVRDT